MKLMRLITSTSTYTTHTVSWQSRNEKNIILTSLGPRNLKFKTCQRYVHVVLHDVHCTIAHHIGLYEQVRTKNECK